MGSKSHMETLQGKRVSSPLCAFLNMTNGNGHPHTKFLKTKA